MLSHSSLPLRGLCVLRRMKMMLSGRRSVGTAMDQLESPAPPPSRQSDAGYEACYSRRDSASLVETTLDAPRKRHGPVDGTSKMMRDLSLVTAIEWRKPSADALGGTILCDFPQSSSFCDFATASTSHRPSKQNRRLPCSTVHYIHYIRLVPIRGQDG
ncbi:hypothetical protein VTO42DRAFT_1806 [Malbranchea cinnamomea]